MHENRIGANDLLSPFDFLRYGIGRGALMPMAQGRRARPVFRAVHDGKHREIASD